MAKMIANLIAGIFLLGLAAGTASAQDPIAAALEDCANEMELYCGTVTPGEGRLVMCAKAHQDKLTPTCIHAVGRAVYWTENLASAINYLAAQCQIDAVTFCPNVEFGEMRVIQCLEGKRESLSKYCALALADVSR